MAAKVDSERGRKIYPLHLAIIEVVFANIRTHKGMNHFTLEEKINVNIQLSLYCMVHNLGEIKSQDLHRRNKKGEDLLRMQITE